MGFVEFCQVLIDFMVSVSNFVGLSLGPEGLDKRGHLLGVIARVEPGIKKTPRVGCPIGHLKHKTPHNSHSTL